MSSDDDTPEIRRAIAAAARDERRLMLEEWRINVQSSLDEAAESRKLATEYAQIALKSAFLVNAGALVALPPLMQWLSAAQRRLIPTSAWLFVIGLMLAAICALLAYANFALIARVDSSDANVLAVQVAVNYGLRDASELKSESHLKEVGVRASRSRWILGTMISSLVSGIGSYIAFFIGVFTFRQIVM